MPSQLRVLHVIPSVSPSRGGPSKAVIEMVSALRESGLDAEIATTNDHGNEVLDLPLNQLIEYKAVPVRFFKRFSPAINSVREFAYSKDFQHWIKKHISEYDLIHVHAIFSFCSTYTMYQARKQKVAYIVRPIGQLETWSLTQSGQRKRNYLRLIERRNLLGANAVHFTAESEKKQALDLIPELNAEVIPLGINIPNKIQDAKRAMCAKWELSEDIPNILFLSRIHPKKGIEYLIQACKQLKQIDFQLIIAGSGDQQYLNKLRTLVTDLGLSKRCKFVGFVDGHDKDLLLQGSDLFCLTSHSENFGIAALEAMASGTAVLLSNEVALSEQVTPQSLGYTTDLNQQGITTTLEKALNQLDTTSVMSSNAQLFVEVHYQWSAISQKLTSLYKRFNK